MFFSNIREPSIRCCHVPHPLKAKLPFKSLSLIREDPPAPVLTAPQDDTEHQPISTSQNASDEADLLKCWP